MVLFGSWPSALLHLMILTDYGRGNSCSCVLVMIIPETDRTLAVNPELRSNYVRIEMSVVLPKSL